MILTNDTALKMSTKAIRHKRQPSYPLPFEIEDTLKKPIFGILKKAPFFDTKNYERKRGYFRKWTNKMFKFDGESGVLSYCDAAAYQSSSQNSEQPSVMLGKCQFFHLGIGSLCESVAELDDLDKSEFVMRLDGITGVQDKALYLSSFTPEDRTRWVSRIMLYIQNVKLDRQKLHEHQRLKQLLRSQETEITLLEEELDHLITISGGLKKQLKTYEVHAEKMRKDNNMLLDKLETVSKEITGLRSSMKETNIADQIAVMNTDIGNDQGASCRFDECEPEADKALKGRANRLNSIEDGDLPNSAGMDDEEYIDAFKKFLAFKRQDILRRSVSRESRRGGSAPVSPTENNKISNILSPNIVNNLNDGVNTTL